MPVDPVPGADPATEPPVAPGGAEALGFGYGCGSGCAGDAADGDGGPDGGAGGDARTAGPVIGRRPGSGRDGLGVLGLALFAFVLILKRRRP